MRPQAPALGRDPAPIFGQAVSAWLKSEGQHGIRSAQSEGIYLRVRSEDLQAKLLLKSERTVLVRSTNMFHNGWGGRVNQRLRT